MPYSLLTCTVRVAPNVMQTLLALLILATAAPATAPSPPSYRCVAATQPINIDGKLNDPSDHDRAWTVEIAIPWKSIKLLSPRAVPPRAGSRWRINLARCEYTRGERGVKFSTWSPHGAVNMHLPDKWGWLEFA